MNESLFSREGDFPQLGRIQFLKNKLTNLNYSYFLEFLFSI